MLGPSGLHDKLLKMFNVPTANRPLGKPAESRTCFGKAVLPSVDVQAVSVPLTIPLEGT